MKLRPQQRGGFAVGLIVGLLIGLALALGVALYVTKVPVPFINKVPQRSAEQDAAEIERNRNWDPNSPLYGKNPAKASSAAAAQPQVATVNVAPAPSASAATARKDQHEARAAPAAAPGLPGLFASQPSTKPGVDPFTYFVQAGAYGRGEDAEQQRAKLAMLGFSAKVTEREQSGRMVYRVRLGPFERKEDADAAKLRLDGSNIDAALVRVQK